MHAALGQRDVQRRGGRHGVVEEHLVEIAHPVEQQRAGVLRLDLQILRHHRRHGVVGHLHPPASGADPTKPARRAESGKSRLVAGQAGRYHRKVRQQGSAAWPSGTSGSINIDHVYRVPHLPQAGRDAGGTDLCHAASAARARTSRSPQPGPGRARSYRRRRTGGALGARPAGRIRRGRDAMSASDRAVRPCHHQRRSTGRECHRHLCRRQSRGDGGEPLPPPWPAQRPGDTLLLQNETSAQVAAAHIGTRPAACA